MQKLIDWYGKVALIVMNFFVMFIILNVILFFYYAVVGEEETPANEPGPLGIYSDELLTQAYPGWDEDARTQLLTENWTRPFICGKYTHYRERPSSGEYVNVTEASFRLNGEPAPWPPDEDRYNIFVFGGSTTFGYGVADYETIPAYLEDHLGEGVQVYNFAQGGFFSTLEMIQFQGLINEGYIPDMAIFIDGHNDAWFNSWFGGEGPYNWQQAPPCEDAQPVIEADSGFELPFVRLANDIRDSAAETQAPQVDAYQQRAIEVAELRNESPEDYQARLEAEAMDVLAEYQTNQQMIRAIAESYGVQPVFVWQPSVYYGYDVHIFPISETLQDTIETTYNAMAAMDWSEWADFLYLADLITGRDDLLFVDEAHYNADLNAEIAREIADFLAQYDL